MTQGLLPADVEQKVHLLSIRVKCNVEELFKSLWMSPDCSVSNCKALAACLVTCGTCCARRVSQVYIGTASGPEQVLAASTPCARRLLTSSVNP